MMTLRQFKALPPTIPSRVAWLLADLGEARGKQELFIRQWPPRLKVLRQNAMIESAVSSNRIAGVEVDRSRVDTVIFGKSALRNRDEKQVRGYRDALRLIHTSSAKLPISKGTIKRLHGLCRGHVWDAGAYKKRPVEIIGTFPDGSERVRFNTVSPRETPRFMAETLHLWKRGLAEKWAHPLLLIPALNLDFLCIHPFRHGNGRVSRLLLLHSLYHCGFEVGRYISLERLIEENKERYYETLEQSSRDWHEGRHDPWPYVGYVLCFLSRAYKEFEARVGQVSSVRGAKTEMIEAAIVKATGDFTVAALERECPGVGRDMVRFVLRRLSKVGRIECLGRGPGAPWRRKGNAPKRG